MIEIFIVTGAITGTVHLLRLFQVHRILIASYIGITCRVSTMRRAWRAMAGQSYAE